MDAILVARVPESKATIEKLAEDMVLATLFQTTTTLPPAPHEQTKRHRGEPR